MQQYSNVGQLVSNLKMLRKALKITRLLSYDLVSSVVLDGMMRRIFRVIA